MKKKIAALVVAMVMAFSMVGTAFAEGTGSLTIKAPDGYAFTAYQVFKGDASNITSGSGVLANVEFANNVAGSDVVAAVNSALELTGENALAGNASAADCAAKLGGANSEILQAFATAMDGKLGSGVTPVESSGGQAVISDLSNGYYIVKTTTPSTTADAPTVQAQVMVAVVGPTTMNAKLTSEPTFDKVIADINDSDGSTTAGNDTADYDIGDKVPYTLTAHVPANIAMYNVYNMKFTDTMDAGLTFDSSSVVVKIGETPISAKSVDSDEAGYVLSANPNGNGFTLDLGDITKYGADISANTVVTVSYKAELNERAAIGNYGNDNEAYLTYTSNGEFEGGGTPTDTHKEKTTVFTYKVVVNKVDKDKNPLDGAVFTLEKRIKHVDGETVTYSWDPIDVAESPSGTEFTSTGLDDGLYKLTESTAPTGYNKAAPIYFKVSANHQEPAQDNSGENASTDLLMVVTDENGEPLTGESVQSFTIDVNAQGGTGSTNVVNNQGTQLPGTGGIGTTIFYVVGGVLVVGAVVALIVRRRTAAAKAHEA